MADGKWITDLTTSTPVEDAARWVLSVRFDVVRTNLRLAVREPEKDIEHVHQLRVGTRRAGAALEIFGVCLPERVWKRTRRQLRGIRRAAGEARDWDVFLEGLADPDPSWAPREEPAVDFLRGYALARRLDAQQRLVDATEDFPFSFERMLAELLGSVRAPRDADGLTTLLDLARPMLLQMLRELDQAAAKDLHDYDRLHQVRIVGKQLRYAMEVFATCFDAPFRDRFYPAVAQMQEILGRANDSHVASQRLGDIRDRLQAFQPQQWKRSRAGIERMLREHQRRLPKERDRFLAWLGEWHDAHVEDAFNDLLTSATVDSVPPLSDESVLVGAAAKDRGQGDGADGGTGDASAGPEPADREAGRG